MSIVPVILAGGAGSRLWPLSRARLPKPFLRLGRPRTLLQETALRVAPLAAEGLAAPIVVCSSAHRFLVSEQLSEVAVEPRTVVLEPMGRNTAPAAALSALLVEPEDLLLVLPADHRMDAGAFVSTVRTGLPAARDGKLVTFGVVPSSADTGLGYIRRGEELGAALGRGVRRIAAFVEKPDAPTAERYVASGEYLWNSGMFLFRADRYLAELERSAGDVVVACRAAIAAGRRDAELLTLDPERFEACPADSIDYAVMEHTQDGAVVELDAGWSDVGSFVSLAAQEATDADGNVVSGDVVMHETTGTLVHASSRLVATVGLEGQVIVETPDAVLVADRERVQEVKEIVDALRAKGRPEVEHGDRVHRPWGSFETLADGDGYQVKRLTVRAGGVLSLQRHRKRAEHWVVASGVARVTVGERTLELRAGESIDIPLGETHRLENPAAPGGEAFELIEVQLGSYLGEDDIERLEDAYGRKGSTEG